MASALAVLLRDRVVRASGVHCTASEDRLQVPGDLTRRYAYCTPLRAMASFTWVACHNPATTLDISTSELSMRCRTSSAMLSGTNGHRVILQQGGSVPGQPDSTKRAMQVHASKLVTVPLSNNIRKLVSDSHKGAVWYLQAARSGEAAC